MREVGAFEAKNSFGTLLTWVAQGEEVVITRRGKAVARLVGNTAAASPDRAIAAASRIRERAAAVKTKPIKQAEWKKLRDEGRA